MDENITMHDLAPKTFFHHIKNIELLKKFFVEVHGITIFPAVNEKTPRGTTVDRLTEMYNALDAAKHESVDKGLAAVSRMASERGVSLLNELAHAYGDDADLEDTLDEGFHDRALYFFLEKNKIFQEALAIDEFYDQQGWKRHPVPKKTLAFIQGKKDALQNTFSEIFREETRGRHCFVEMYKRGDCLYIVISFEDYPQIASQMKEDGVDRTGFFRPLKQIYFLYTPDDEELQIKYRGAWEEREKYLETFLKVVFGIPLQDTKRTFDLGQFKNSHFSLDLGVHTDAVESWLLRVMDLELVGIKKKIKLTVPAKSATKMGAADMWDLLDTVHLSRRMGEVRINQIEITIRFKDPDGRTGVRSVPFTINWKDNCTLCKLNDFEKKAEDILISSKINYGFGQKTAP